MKDQIDGSPVSVNASCFEEAILKMYFLREQFLKGSNEEKIFFNTRFITF